MRYRCFQRGRRRHEHRHRAGSGRDGWAGYCVARVCHVLREGALDRGISVGTVVHLRSLHRLPASPAASAALLPGAALLALALKRRKLRQHPPLATPAKMRINARRERPSRSAAVRASQASVVHSWSPLSRASAGVVRYDSHYTV